jgi:hypothetical protein
VQAQRPEETQQREETFPDKFRSEYPHNFPLTFRVHFKMGMRESLFTTGHKNREERSFEI